MKLAEFVSRIHPQGAFAVLAVLFGTLFLVITPPFQVPDEYNHFFRSYQVSEGRIFSQRSEKGEIGWYVPESVVHTMDAVGAHLRFHPENKIKVGEITSFLNLPLKSDRKIFVDFGNTALYAPVSYLPQGLGIFLGRLLGLSPLGLLYLGRFFSLVSWVLMVFLAIRRTPFFKWVFFLLALVPTSLFEAASVSADGVTYGLAFLLTAQFLYYAFDTDGWVGPGMLINIFTLSVLLALSKQSYFLLPCLFLLIPVYKIGSRKLFTALFIFLLLSCMGAAGLWMWLIREHYDALRLEPGVSHHDQLVFIVSHPLKYCLVFVRSHVQSFRYLTAQFIGNLGWHDTPLPRELKISYLFLLFLAALFSSGRSGRMSAWQRFVIFATWAASVSLITTIVYLSWVPVGSPLVTGMQARYFIPVAPLFFLTLYNGKTGWCEETGKLGLASVGYCFLALSVTLVTLIDRYYI